MAKKLIPEEIEDLIQQYLTDGVLTDKERQVILRKAEGMGLDRDEIDLYLDAEVQKIEQAAGSITRQRKGKTCPYCGASVPLLTEKCPYCGENITPEASDELKEIFDNLETALIDLKDAKAYKHNKAIVERYVRKAKMYYGSNLKVQKLLAEVEIEMSVAEKKAKSQARIIMLKAFIANPWTYGALFIIFTILWIGFCVYKAANGDDEMSQFCWGMCGAFISGGVCIILTFLFIKHVCLKKN